MSTVSVFIPCYRYGHFLEAAVSSVLDDQPEADLSSPGATERFLLLVEGCAA